jgi:non-homologous end joining protein Ku
MAVRPSWEGHLRLSLVTCPVALYPATSEAESIHFNLINPATNNRSIDDTLADLLYDQERMLQHEIEDLSPV